MLVPRHPYKREYSGSLWALMYNCVQVLFGGVPSALFVSTFRTLCWLYTQDGPVERKELERENMRQFVHSVCVRWVHAACSMHFVSFHKVCTITFLQVNQTVPKQNKQAI